MAMVYITEYAEISNLPVGRVGQMPRDPPVTEQTVAISVSSVQSAAFNSATKLIRIHTDAVCSIVIGSNPIATSANARFATNQTEYRDVSAGGLKLAVITNS